MHKIDRPFELKSIDAATGRFSGYASVFGELDSYSDVVMPGAFLNSIKTKFTQKGRKVPMLWQHWTDKPIGVFDVVKEDAHGLYVEGECNMGVQIAKEAHSLMTQGALTGLSIGYDVVKSEWSSDYSVQKLVEIDLWEISPVTFPAGDGARINNVKSIEGFAALSDFERHLREANGYSKQEATAFVSRLKAVAMKRGDPAKSEADMLKAVHSIIQRIEK